MREKSLFRLVAMFAVVSVLINSSGAVTAQSPIAAAPSRTAPVTSAADAGADGGWPRSYTSAAGARIVLYQPQVGSWPGQTHMTIYVATSYLPKGTTVPLLGALTIEADTKVALEDRLVNFSDFEITDASFARIPKNEVKPILDEITAAVPREDRVIGLDRVLAMVDASQVTAPNADGVKADPPPIFYSDTPAILVNLDGPPIWSPIMGTDLRFAVNTNWDLFEYAETHATYLRHDKQWLTASSLDGPWKRTTVLPASFSRLPDDANFSEVRAALQPAAAGALPKVFVSEMPAELLLVNGTPKYLPVGNTKLLWVSNTDSDVFRLGAGGNVYYLISGRWFTAPNFSGPWAFATPSLPNEFKQIPLSHPRSRVLASVPGTRQALEAILLAQIPQTARVNRHEISPPAVTYQGTPDFQPIEQTTVARAVNTDKDILKAGDMYYMCADGVWFMSRSATGPWTIADTIPKEIYEIPISSPAHPVTYVTVEDYDDDYVDYAAAAAYSGMMVAWGTAVWGTGWYYPPYYWPGSYYPIYYPSYPSYGYGARYNPWTGAYTRGGAVYGPYGGAGYGARYNPTTGSWARGAAAYGPAGSRGAIQAYNPRTGTAGSSVRGSNVYGSWGSTAVQRGDQWAQTSRLTRNATGTTSRVTSGSGGGEALTRRGPQGSSFVGRTGSGDVYAGRDGSVYRNQGGTWQKYGNGGWTSAERPVGTSGSVADRAARSDTYSQLNSDRNARLDGAQRTRDLNRASRTGSGSYRPGTGSGSFGGGNFRGGGVSRGGGGFRGGGRR